MRHSQGLMFTLAKRWGPIQHEPRHKSRVNLKNVLICTTGAAVVLGAGVLSSDKTTEYRVIYREKVRTVTETVHAPAPPLPAICSDTSKIDRLNKLVFEQANAVFAAKDNMSDARIAIADGDISGTLPAQEELIDLDHALKEFYTEYNELKADIEDDRQSCKSQLEKESK